MTLFITISSLLTSTSQRPHLGSPLKNSSTHPSAEGTRLDSQRTCHCPQSSEDPHCGHVQLLDIHFLIVIASVPIYSTCGLSNPI
mmetsp:Transcript_141455/g.246612  ORF Transcript_141455/g.246612 Transcript_141455/m.246612 type:complete len:85 (+) Transcript_141455:793-1047(+)